VNQQPAEQDSTPYWARPSTFTSDCRLVEDSIDEYSLGIADSSQQVAIERHLTRCKRCSELVGSYRQSVAVLALAVPLVSPPASARTALLSRIAATSQGVAPPEPVFSGNLDSFRTPTLPSANAIVAPMPAQTSSQDAWWRVYAAPLATLPLLLALGLMGAWGFNNYAKLDDARDTIAMQDAEMAKQDDQSDLDQQQYVQLAFSSSSMKYPMSGGQTSQNGPSWGTLLADPITGQSALKVNGLNPGYYVVLVQTRDGSMEEKALFEVGEDGTALTAVDLGEQVADFQSVHIRPSSAFMETDTADYSDVTDVLMAAFKPDITQGSGTGVQGP
jgi:hypothetical protein